MLPALGTRKEVNAITVFPSAEAHLSPGGNFWLKAAFVQVPQPVEEGEGARADPS